MTPVALSTERREVAAPGSRASDSSTTSSGDTSPRAGRQRLGHGRLDPADAQSSSRLDQAGVRQHDVGARRPAPGVVHASLPRGWVSWRRRTGIEPA